MKAAAKRQIARAIQATMPSLCEKGRLVAATPRGRILRGLYLEDSSDPAKVYVWAFVQPLYLPASTVIFNFGRRLGGPSKTWSTDDADELVEVVGDEGLPFFSNVATPEAFVAWRLLEGRTDLRSNEAKAYSLVACGRFTAAVRDLRVLVRSISTETLPWIVEARGNAERLADLADSSPVAAAELLASWEGKTVSALRIHDVP